MTSTTAAIWDRSTSATSPSEARTPSAWIDGRHPVDVGPMTAADLGPAARVSAMVLREGDGVSRMDHFLSVDPDGCWVAVEADQLVGLALSQVRGELWFLSAFAVLPSHQGRGIGKRLLHKALEHAEGRRVMSISTTHPAATRRHRWAGFSLNPLMRMVGSVDRSKLRAVRGLRDGRPGDVGWMDRLDLVLRGAGHGPDHDLMARSARLVVSSSRSQPGYVYVDPSGCPSLLAATDRDTAAALLREALASSEADTVVDAITTSNQWAVDVGLSAGLEIGQAGFLAVHGMADPAPYLPDRHVL
jgi:GNAT superfamily N-acetyltransferase